MDYTPNVRSPTGAGPETPASLTASGYLVPVDSVWFQHCSTKEGGVGYAEVYRSCYRVKWPSHVQFPENCVAMMDTHKATAPYDETIQLDRLDGMELESINLFMLLTALSKGVIYGLLLKRRGTGDIVPEYERVGFVNGLDAIGEFCTWSSSSYSSEPMFTDDWYPGGLSGISSILEDVGIAKTTTKIW